MKIKLIKISAAFLILFAAIYLIMTLWIYNFGTHAKAKKSDCIIVLGCSLYGKTPSPFLKGRLNEGIRLYNKGLGKYIIVSGGMGPGEKTTEASAMKEYLVKAGIPSEAVITEDGSINTRQNIRNSKGIMDSKGYKSAIVVSNSFHLKRASLLCNNYKIDASFSGIFLEKYKSQELYGLFREVPAYIKCLLGG